MIVFFTSVISVLLLAVVCYQVFKDASAREGQRDRTASILIGTAVLSLCVDYVTGCFSVWMLMLEITPASVAMLVLSSSLWERRKVRHVATASVILYAMLICLNISVALDWVRPPSRMVLLPVNMVLSLIPLGFFVVGISRRLRDVKSILKTGTIWVNVSLAVESVYILFYQLIAFFFFSGSALCRNGDGDCLLAFPLLNALLLAAIGVRHADDILFVFWRRQERRIVESMKVTKVETAMDPSGIEDTYQDIYERVVAYFDSEKPFLDNGLTINDLVKTLYSNKLYISRAISQFTGRNFCQFVNYYRVRYSMELFRSNTDLKIHELASGSGFNSDVSYNMAFRLFMGETPGEWCKKERRRKIKMKK